LKGAVTSGTANAAKTSELTIAQGGIALPEDTVVTISAYVKPLRSGSTTSAPLSFTLNFDDVAVAPVFIPKNTDEDKWTRVMGTVTLKRAGMHTLSLDVLTKGVTGEIFAVDDLSVQATLPTGTRICPR
jgi:hypothetical protein